MDTVFYHEQPVPCYAQSGSIKYLSKSRSRIYNPRQNQNSVISSSMFDMYTCFISLSIIHLTSTMTTRKCTELSLKHFCQFLPPPLPRSTLLALSPLLPPPGPCPSPLLSLSLPLLALSPPSPPSCPPPLSPHLPRSTPLSFSQF